MSYWGWKPYVPVGERRKKAERAAVKAKKAGAALSPIAASRGAVAKTFWGKAWCENLERYSDFANRLPRGRSYVRNGSVIDLVIAPGEVRAQVMGSSLYRVEVRVAPVVEKRWKAIGADCAGSIDSMVELLQGTFSAAVMRRLCRAGDGLFPAPKEIEFTCSCPDWASMCKHVAAVLYGVGARLDRLPELLFDLRRVDGKDLLAQAGAGLTRPKGAPAKARVLEGAVLADVFDIEIADVAASAESVRAPARQGKKAPSGVVKAASNGKQTSRRSSGPKANAQVKAALAVTARRTAPSKSATGVSVRTTNRAESSRAITTTRKSRQLSAPPSVKRKSQRKQS